jgi:cytoskeletal protein RodZ
MGIGVKLQDARKRRGVSLREVADSTKIPVRILEAIECDDISGLPSGVCGRGFVRSFSAAVGLDPEATVAEFVVQFPLGSVAAGYPAAEAVVAKDGPDIRVSEASTKSRRWKVSTLRLAAVGVFPAALLVYFGTGKAWPQWPALQGRTATARARLMNTFVRLDASGENAVRAQGSDENSVESDEPSARSAAAGLRPTVNVSTDSVAAPAVQAGGDSTLAAASSAPTMEFASDSSAGNAESSPGVDGEAPDAGMLVGDRLVVVLSVTSPSWVIATVDGKKTVNRLMQVGEQETLEARRSLILTAGDAGAIVMTLNGASAKSLGPPGDTIVAHINRTNFTNYLRR